MTHICVGTNTNIGSDNGLSPGRCQAIFWTNAGILLIGPPGTNFSGILSEIHTFSFKKMHFKTSSAKWRPSCLGLNVLNQRENSLMWLSGSCFHAPLHNFLPFTSAVGYHCISLNPAAASNAFSCNFVNTGPINSIQLSNRHAICWKSDF